MSDVFEPQYSTSPPNKRSGLWLTLLGLTGLCFVLFFYKLGSYPFFDVDEPRYAETAREMLERGDWITPYFNYELRLNKPVFFYWLVATAYQWFGVSEFAARFFSALTATGMVFGTYALGRWWLGNRFALFSAIVLATSIEIIGLARMSVTDMTLAFFISATILTLFLVAHHSKKWWLLAGVLSGFAILTKGPVGIVVPGAVLVLYSLFTRQFTRCFLNRWFPLAILTALAVSIPWYFAAWQVHGDFFLQELYENNFSRFNGQINYHIKPWWFYLPVLAIGFMPWSIFLPVSLTMAVQNLRGKQDGFYALSLYCLTWAGFILLFFSVAQTKLLTYVLPMFPALALMVGLSFERLALSQTSKTVTRSFWLLSSTFAIALVVAAPLFIGQPATFLPKIAREITELTSNPLSLIAVYTLVIGTVMMSYFLMRKQVVFALTSQAIAFSVLTIAALNSILPSVNQATQGAMLSFSQQAEGKPLAIYEITRPSLTYYSRKKIPHVARDDYGKLNGLLRTAHDTTGDGLLYIITKNSLLDDLESVVPKNSTLTLIDKQAVYSLLTLQLEPNTTQRTPSP